MQLALPKRKSYLAIALINRRCVVNSAILRSESVESERDQLTQDKQNKTQPGPIEGPCVLAILLTRRTEICSQADHISITVNLLRLDRCMDPPASQSRWVGSGLPFSVVQYTTLSHPKVVSAIYFLVCL